MDLESKDGLHWIHVILNSLRTGKSERAISLFNLREAELSSRAEYSVFLADFRKFILQYSAGATCLKAIALGKLDIEPPTDPLRENDMFAQYKQLHSNLLHLTWQSQQIAKGDLQQRVRFMGDFSVAFNTMIEKLRVKEKLKEQIRIQNEDLQRLNAEKDKFFSIIAHDLKSPFNAIMGFSELLAEQVKQKDMDGIDKYADIIVQASGKAVNLLMNLMEWSRSQTGRIAFTPAELNLFEIVSQTSDLLYAAAMQKSIALEVAVMDDIRVFADTAMLSTILRNLISNAIKYTRSGGKITIAARKENKEVLISVSDTGVGIPQNMIERLFRIDDNYTTSGTQDEQGTGLGLILCREFVEKHGGKIWVESKRARGSDFYFTLPDF